MFENNGGTVAEFGGLKCSCGWGAQELFEAVDGGYMDKRLGCLFGSLLNVIGTVPREPSEGYRSSGSKGNWGGIGLNGGNV